MRTPALVFEIPCPHPSAKGGVFYCEATNLNTPHMRDRYVFIMADTQKLVALLRRSEPAMLEHARNKFRGSTAKEWLSGNSKENAPEMGNWAYSRERGLTLSSGQAAMIQLAQEIRIPCFPIAIEKDCGYAVIEELKKKIEHRESNIYHFTQIKYRPNDHRSSDFRDYSND